MKTRISFTAFALAGALALGLAVPNLAPRLADRFTPPTTPVVSAPDLAPSTSSPTRSSTSPATGTTTSPTDQQSKGVALIAALTARGEAAGTGMVLTADGQVLTNYHVVQGSTQLQVTVADTGVTYRAAVVGHDASKDVALLRLEGASGLSTITPDPDQVRIGQQLTAVGNASGGGELIAAPGRVTGLEQQVSVSDDTGGTETLTGVIRTDAGAVPGDSGGPMFDAQGEVLGMTTAGSAAVTRGPRGVQQSATTTSYAVPIQDALAVVTQIRTGRSSGTVQVGAKAYLGISVAETSGLQVASVETGGPAATSGLRVGGRITSLQGTAVTTHADLSAVLAGLAPGAKVPLTWVDATGSSHRATVTLGSSPVN